MLRELLYLPRLFTKKESGVSRTGFLTPFIAPVYDSQYSYGLLCPEFQLYSCSYAGASEH